MKPIFYIIFLFVALTFLVHLRNATPINPKELSVMNGHLIWKITDQTKYNKLGYLISPPIYTSQFGYKLEGRIYPDNKCNDGTRRNGVGVSVRLVPGEYDAILDWPINATLTFTLYDQSLKNKKNIVRSTRIDCEQCPVCCQRPSYHLDKNDWGYNCFVSGPEIWSGGYILNKMMFLGIKVTDLGHTAVVSEPATNITIQRNIRPWTNATIPYIISDGVTLNIKFSDEEKKLLKQAMCHIEKHSCVRFVLRTNETNYTKISKSYECNSDIGMIGGVQEINLGPVCFESSPKSTLIHELLHTIGFTHEHSRLDRDQYVSIFEENIFGKTGYHNFYKYSPPSPNYLGPYDIDSIMHYTGKEYMSGSNRTILIKSTNTELQDRVNMTMIDIQKLNSWNSCQDFPINRSSSLNCHIKSSTLQLVF